MTKLIHGIEQKFDEPLKNWKFINVEKMGARHIVSLTDEGINALRFLHENK